MIRRSDIIERYYTYYSKSCIELEFSVMRGVGLRHNGYLCDTIRSMYSAPYGENATTRIKVIKYDKQ